MIEVANRLHTVEEYYFSKKLEEIRQMSKNGIKVLNLGIGSPDLPPEAEVIEELVTSARNINNHAYQSYRCSAELRESIARFYFETFSVKLDSEKEILPLLGSKEGVMYISMAFLNPGDTILVPNPGYPAYKAIAKLLGVNVIEYNLTEENSWQPDFDELENYALDDVKLMWINYPHMPTGTPATVNLFKQFIHFAIRHNILLCNDNPYSQVLNNVPLSILQFDTALTHVLELNSLSKSFNMAGWRVGMVLGHKRYIDAILKAKSNVDSGMFLPIQHAAIKALQLKQEWHDERNNIYETRRDKAIKILELIDCQVSKGQVGMFIWAKVPDYIEKTYEFIDELLYNAGVFITPGEVFGSNGEKFIRISLCSAENIFDQALNNLRLWKEKKLQLV